LADRAGELDRFLSLYSQLPIVNPTKAKFQQTVLNQNYYDLLRVFSNDLEKENSVLFLIGFSCRDEHIRELLVRAAQTNPTLQIFVFAYKPPAIAEFEDRFAGYQTSNGNIRIIGPATPNDGEAQEVYNLKTITSKFFEPLVPRPPRRPDAQVDVSIALQDPLVRADD
jgi:SIR2-like domain